MLFRKERGKKKEGKNRKTGVRKKEKDRGGIFAGYWSESRQYQRAQFCLPSGDFLTE